MTTRILRIELRRSAAWWTALAIALIGASLLFVVLTRWGGRWTPLAVVQREQLYVLWPLALAAGGWQGRREARARVRELLATTPQPQWRRILPTAAAMGIAVIVGYLAIFAAAAGQAAQHATYFPAASLLVVAIGVLSMVAAVWLGLAVGALLPSPLTPPALLVAGMATLMAVPVLLGSRGRSAVTLLSPVLTPRTTDFYAVAARVHLGQLLWFAALAATALVLATSTGRRARLAALLPALLGGLGAVPLLPHDADHAYVLDPAAQAWVCTAEAPKVCVTKVHAAALAQLRTPARRAVEILSTKLPDAPTLVREARRSWIEENPEPQRPDTLLVQLYPGADGRLDPPDQVLWALLDGAGTQPCGGIFASPDETIARHHAARMATAAWLLDQPPPKGAYFSGQARQAWDTLRGLPADEQRARVMSLRAAARACDGRDLLTVLIGGPAR